MSVNLSCGVRELGSEEHWYGYEILWCPSWVSWGLWTVATSGRGVSHLPHCGKLGEFTLILTRYPFGGLAMVLWQWGRGRGFGVRGIEVRIVG